MFIANFFNRLFFVLCLLGVIIYRGQAYAATIIASDCSLSRVQAAVDAAVDGDIVVVPSGTQALCTWSSTLRISKAITLQGSGCLYNDADIPTSCSTVIYFASNTGSELILWTLVPNKVSRMTGLEFRNSNAFGNVVGFLGTAGGGPQDSRRFRADHNRFVRLGGFNIVAYSSYGLIDHNYFDLVGIGLYFYYPADYDYADARWAESPTDWGSNNFSFVENNKVEVTSTRSFAFPFTDAYAGAKFVVRFNDITQSNVQNHGTESSGRARGGRAMEVYKNNFSGNDVYSSVTVFLRSGTLLNWGNSWSQFPVNNLPAASLVYYRALGAPIFGASDGTNPWDVNDPTNPQNPGSACPSNICIAAANSISDPSRNSHTVRVSGASWTVDQWRGYSIRKQSCIAQNMLQPCGLLIEHNDVDSITYSYANPGMHLDFLTGETFTINKILHGYDAPCRSGGSLISAKWTRSITHVGNIATVTLPAHGLNTNDYVAIWDDSSANPSIYNGNYKISVLDTDHFSYTTGSTPPANSSFASVTKLVGGENNQVTEACYQWLNTLSGNNMTFNSDPYPIRQREHYYDYEPSKMFDGTISLARSSIGVGSIANRPVTCQVGAAYWANDEGEWNSTNNGPDGQLYKCVSTNTWSLVYKPYQYPHPLATGVSNQSPAAPKNLSITN